MKRRDLVSVSQNNKLVGTGEILRIHRNGTVSVLWSNSASILDGRFQQEFDPARDGQRLVSRVDASYCTVLVSAKTTS